MAGSVSPATGRLFHHRPGCSGAHAEEILAGFDGTIQADAYGGYDRLARKRAPGARRSSWRSAGPTAEES